MSFQYDQYLDRHRANVKRGFDWLSENLPGVVDTTITAGWNMLMINPRMTRMSMMLTMLIFMEIIDHMKSSRIIRGHGYAIFTETHIIGSIGF